MKEISSISKGYKITILLTIIAMVLGLVTTPEGTSTGAFMLQLLFVAVTSTFLVLYPKFETEMGKVLLVLIIAGYFYTLFFIYPETILNILLVALIPAIAIAFYNEKLFYALSATNIMFAIGMFAFLYFTENDGIFVFLREDLIGNFINFLGSQIIMYLVFVLNSNRIEKIKMYYEQVQRAESLKTSGQLAAAVAHEIRNPITVVKGFLQIYTKDKRLPEDTTKHFELMLNELENAEAVIQDFLSLSKQGTHEKEKIDVEAALRSVIDLISSYALMNNVRIALCVDRNAYLQCSLIEFKQVVVNILKNAIEATEESGTVNVSLVHEHEKVLIKVEDEGIGMSSEELIRLGTPFYSLKSQGTGLGLMICFNIMEKYGGKIQYKSKKGKGTTTFLHFKRFID